MTLGWYSPLPHARSGIADYTAHLAEALAAQQETSFWTFADIVSAPFSEKYSVHKFKPGTHIAPKQIGAVQQRIYNIGNNAQFHGDIFRHASIFPGHIILHDTNLHGMVRGWLNKQPKARKKYENILRTYYGEEAVLEEAQCFNDPSARQELIKKTPFTEYVCENALSIIVHSSPAFEAVKKFARCPVHFLNLPTALAPGKDEASEPSPSFSSPLRIILFGHLGLNRCIPDVFQALSASSYRGQFTLDLVGSWPPASKLDQKIKTHGLEDCVTLHGHVGEKVLDNLLSKADIALNLRNPTMGEASASQLMLWAHGLPTLVSDTGWYGEQPSETVRLCAPGNEVTGVKDFIAEAFERPGALMHLAQNGRRHVYQHHNVDQYVQGLSLFLDDVTCGPPTHVRRLMHQRADATMKSITGSFPRKELTYQKQIAEICGAGIAQARRVTLLTAKNLDGLDNAPRIRAKLVFMHLPKTGGTSLRQYFEKFIFPENECFPDGLKLNPPQSWPHHIIKQCRYFDAHASYRQFYSLVGPAHYITMFRDPVERAVSYYWHLVRQIDEFPEDNRPELIRLAAENDLEGWLKYPAAYPRNMATTMLVSPTLNAPQMSEGSSKSQIMDEAYQRLKNDFSFFGMMNAMQDSLELLQYTFGFSADNFNQNFQENQRPSGKIHRQDLAAGVIEQIEAQNTMDVELFKKAQRLFDERCAHMRMARS